MKDKFEARDLIKEYIERNIIYQNKFNSATLAKELGLSNEVTNDAILDLLKEDNYYEIELNNQIFRLSDVASFEYATGWITFDDEINELVEMNRQKRSRMRIVVLFGSIVVFLGFFLIIFLIANALGYPDFAAYVTAGAIIALILLGSSIAGSRDRKRSFSERLIAALL